MTVNSDDFSDVSGTLSSIWSLEGPAANGRVQVAGQDAFVALSVPAGDFDIFNGEYNATRLLQDTTDSDLSVEAKFLSEPTERFQIQGIVVEQDQDNWLRFDVRSDGTNLKLFGATTVNDNTTVRFDITIQSGDAQFLRVVRTGDIWSLEYSADGVTFTQAGSFTHQMTVTGVGPFAAATGGAPGFTAQVDYFFNTDAPISPEDATLPPANQAPDAIDDALAATFETDLTINVTNDLLGNDTDPENNSLTLQSFTQPASGTLTDNGNGTLTFTPASGFIGSDTFTYTVSDGAGNSDTATVTIDVTIPTTPVPILENGPSGFNGSTNSAVILPHDAAYLLPAGAWAIQFNADEVEGRQFLISKDSSGFDTGGHFGLYLNGDDLIARFQDLSSTTELVIPNIISVGTEYQVVVNFGPGGIEVWLDGVLVGTDAFTGGLVGNEEPISIGANQWASGDLVADNLRDAFDGTIETVALFDGRLDGDDINAFFNGAPEIVAVDDTVNGDADTDLTIDVAVDLLGNDFDTSGDQLQLESFTQPVNGTLTDNTDGTLTYAPNPGFDGPDTFTYTTVDGNGNSATATVTVNVAPAPSALVSDDFSDAGGVLLPIWSLEGPAATASVQSNGTDAFVALSVPAGDFDIFNGEYNATRLLQDVSGGDLSIEAKFLSEPTERFQIQGIVVEQDQDNWLRFDVRSDGSNLLLFAGTTVNGSTSVRFNFTVQPGDAQFLRASRTGDDWTLEYSADGVTFTEAGSFTHQMTVTGAGPFAAATGGAPGFTAEVDYFFNADSPISPEDATLPPPNLAPDAVDDALATTFESDLVINVSNDLLGNDTDPENNALTLLGFTQPANGTLADNGNGSLTYTPDDGFVGGDTFTYTITDGAGNTDTATVTVDVALPTAPIPILEGGPSGFNGSTNSAVILPHDAAYLLPAGAWAIQFNADEVEGRQFLISKDSSGFDNGGHFGLYLNGDDLIARFQDLTETTEVVVANVISVGIDHQVVVNFGSGGIEVWLDGALVGTDAFTGGLVGNEEPISIGANQWASGDLVADNLRDAFDGTVETVALFDGRLDADDINAYFNGAPEIVALDDTVNGDANTDLDIDVAADLLGNDFDASGDPLQLDSFTQPSNGTLTDNTDGTLTYSPNPDFDGQDTFTYTTIDGNGNSATATVTVNVAPPPAFLVSDDFSDASGAILPIWSLEGPSPSAEIVVAGPEAFVALSVPAGDFDIFNGEYNATRLLQDVSGGDLSIEAKFLSEPTERFQIQGIVVEQDEDNWLRFDLRFDGSSLMLFAGTTVNDVTSTQFDIAVQPGDAQFLRASRTGDDWTLEYSADGVTFIEAGSFTHQMVVTGAGPFAAATGGAPGFTAEVDYVFNTASPIVPEDDFVANGAPVAQDDSIVLDEDNDFTFQPGANDSDPENDTVIAATIDTDPVNGSATVNPDGTVTYTPDADFNGSDSFTIVVTDGNLGFDTSTVNVTVSSVDDDPVAVQDSYQVDTNGDVTVTAALGVLANDNDPDGTSLTAAELVGPTKGTLSFNPDGSFTYTAGAAFDGNDSFTYTVNDGNGGSNTGTVTLFDVNEAPQLLSGEVSFGTLVIDNTLPLGHTVYSADFDGDGDLDLLATSEQASEVAWFENDGALGFTKRFVDPALDRAYPAGIVDIDGDGDIDVLAGGFSADQFIVYENDGNGNFNTLAILSGNGPHSIYAADIDGDGDQDILTSAQNDRNISWWENNGSSSFTQRIVSNTVFLVKTAIHSDVDSDGDLDIIATSNGSDEVIWFENDGAENFTEIIIDNDFDGSYYAIGADLDGDGDTDIAGVAQNDNQLTWYRNDGSENFTKVVIDSSVSGAREVEATDIDLDGDLDLLATARDGGFITLALNDGAGNFTTSQAIQNISGPYGIASADINGDGLVDVFSAANDSGETAIHLQERIHNLEVLPGEATLIDEQILLTTDPDDGPAELTYTLVNVPSNGDLLLNGGSLSAGQTFTQDDVNEERLTYVPSTGIGTTDSFNFTVADGGEGGIPAISGSFAISVVGELGGFPTPIFEATPSTIIFDGSNGDVINLPPSTLQAAEGTIVFSFSAPDVNDRQGLFSVDASGFAGTGDHIAIYLDDGDLLARFQDGANSETLRFQNVSVNQQYQVGATFGASGVELYIDDVLVDQDTRVAPDLSQNLEFVQLGALGWGSSSGDDSFRDPFEGTLNNVLVFDEILTQQQLDDLI